ncbi:MAG: lycopene cyclase family protein [Rhodospirillales bacterium]|jgi:lycopene beta-cyclase
MQTEIKEFDLTIIGAGLSGICLVHELIERLGIDLNILLVGPADERYQTICTWERDGAKPWYNDYIRTRWSSWYFKYNNQKTHHVSQKYKYVVLNTQSLRSDIYAQITDIDWITHHRSNVTGVQKVNDLFYINTAAGAFTSKQVVDTRPPKPAKGIMLQHFFGLEIKVPFDQLNKIKNDICMMDFDIEQNDATGTCFIYALPFENNIILIEATFFSMELKEQTVYTNHIRNWLLSDYSINLDKCEIIERESGVIPMGPVIPIDTSLIRLGTAGGAVKLSTGYAFKHILNQSANLVTQINDKRNITTFNPHPKFSQYLDKIFLNVLKDRPKIIPSVFMRMAKNLAPDTFVEFLNEQNILKSSFKMILAMPKIPFILSFLKNSKSKND